MLDRLIEHNDRIPLTPNSLTRFHSRAPPSIGVRDYLLRIARYTNVEPCCLLILLPYVDKGQEPRFSHFHFSAVANVVRVCLDSLRKNEHLHNLVFDRSSIHYCGSQRWK